MGGGGGAGVAGGGAEESGSGLRWLLGMGGGQVGCGLGDSGSAGQACVTGLPHLGGGNGGGRRRPLGFLPCRLLLPRPGAARRDGRLALLGGLRCRVRVRRRAIRRRVRRRRRYRLGSLRLPLGNEARGPVPRDRADVAAADHRCGWLHRLHGRQRRVAAHAAGHLWVPCSGCRERAWRGQAGWIAWPHHPQPLQSWQRDFSPEVCRVAQARRLASQVAGVEAVAPPLRRRFQRWVSPRSPPPPLRPPG